MAHKIFPHGSITEVAPGLYQVEGSLPFPLKRNMTLIKLKSGGLLIYSAVALDDAGLAELEKLGRPEVIVVPQPFHTMDLAFYKNRYPDLKVWGAKAGEIYHGVSVDADILKAMNDPRISATLVPGLKFHEIHLQFEVPGGHALIVCDLFAGDDCYATGFGAKLAKFILGTSSGGFGIAKIVKWRQISDRAKVKKYITDLAEDAQLKLVLVCHGVPLRESVATRLSEAAAQL
ncbi:MAG: hypothetical protein JNJ69_04400 [Leptospiraceae bacterium]|nr:hypothetical protein [Leptospiraceae bacterium]